MYQDSHQLQKDYVHMIHCILGLVYHHALLEHLVKLSLLYHQAPQEHLVKMSLFWIGKPSLLANQRSLLDYLYFLHPTMDRRLRWQQRT